LILKRGAQNSLVRVDFSLRREVFFVVIGAIALDQVVVENTLLAAIIVGSIYLERWLQEKARRRKERETKKITINFVINDLESKLRFIEESHQYKDYKPFSTDMWDAIILTSRHSLLSFAHTQVMLERDIESYGVGCSRPLAL